MEYDIKEKKENILLSRTEILMEIKHQGSANPPYKAVKKEIANQLKADENLIVVKHIYPAFGEGKSSVIAYIYKDEASLKNIEPRNKKAEASAKKAAEEAKKTPAEAIKEQAKPDVQEQKKQESEKEPASAQESPAEKKKPEGEK